MQKHGLTYSTGGVSYDGDPPVVLGTVTGPGRVIEITGASVCPPLCMINLGSANVVFRIECNMSLASPTSPFVPDPTLWVNAVKAADITLVAGETEVFTMANQIPFWRTNIISIDPGGNLVSFANYILDRAGKWLRAKYPDQQSALWRLE